MLLSAGCRLPTGLIGILLIFSFSLLLPIKSQLYHFSIEVYCCNITIIIIPSSLFDDPKPWLRARRVDAGKVELDGAQYLGFSLPFSISQLLWIEVLLVGGAEIYRNSSTDLEERIYPGARALKNP